MPDGVHTTQLAKLAMDALPVDAKVPKVYFLAIV